MAGMFGDEGYIFSDPPLSLADIPDDYADIPQTLEADTSPGPTSYLETVLQQRVTDRYSSKGTINPILDAIPSFPKFEWPSLPSAWQIGIFLLIAGVLIVGTKTAVEEII